MGLVPHAVCRDRGGDGGKYPGSRGHGFPPPGGHSAFRPWQLVAVARSSFVLPVVTLIDDAFRARLLQINNFGDGDVLLDLSTTEACSTEYTISSAGAVTLSHLGGVRGFSITGSTAGGTPTVSYLAST